MSQFPTACINITDEVYCAVSGLAPAHVKYFYDKFGPYVDGHRYIPSVKMGRWDGRKRFFQPTGKTFVRLLDDIIPDLIGFGYKVDVVDKRTPTPFPKKWASEDQFGHILGYRGKPLAVRGYQVAAVNDLVSYGDGFLIAATGAGKTLITASLADIYNSAGYTVVIIVPSGDLVKQTVAALQMCGLDVGQYDGEHKDVDHATVVATWQALQNNPHLMKLFKCVVVDEAHGAKAETIQTLINDHGAHIPFRFGVTGTFPKPEADQMALISAIGPIRHQITARWLIDNGYLAEIDIDVFETSDTPEGGDMPDYTSERAWLARNDERAELIAGIVEECRALYGNTLVLTPDVKYGKKLAKLCGATFMHGETDGDDRQGEYALFESENDKILICSMGIAKQGISIDRVFCLVIIDSGKSFITAIQSVGRGLRMAEDKKYVKVVDISSSMKFSKKHRKDRIAYYNEAGYPTSKVQKLKY
jgi:superfamily II DNA or RNA helicase